MQLNIRHLRRLSISMSVTALPAVKFPEEHKSSEDMRVSKSQSSTQLVCPSRVLPPSMCGISGVWVAVSSCCASVIPADVIKTLQMSVIHPQDEGTRDRERDRVWLWHSEKRGVIKGGRENVRSDRRREMPEWRWKAFSFQTAAQFRLLGKVDPGLSYG